LCNYIEVVSLNDAAVHGKVEGAPPEVGTKLRGFAAHVDGAPVPQDRVTRLLYPFEEVRVPVNIAGVFTATLNEGLPINIAKSGKAFAIVSESS
jgi:hypothetical protein